MSEPIVAPPHIYPLPPLASPEKTLRRLFLTLFLRGRTSRGLRKDKAPQSIGSKLAMVLLIYSIMGLFALSFRHKSVFLLSFYLHALTFALLGMFVAASSGEILFNKDESDILLHRPINPRELLRAKMSVIVQVSLWMAGAFNLVGFFVGFKTAETGWLFLIAHAVSVGIQGMFCVSAVVVIYQLCLRWCGRERLDSIMTMAQILFTVGVILAGQIFPRIMMRMGDRLDFQPFKAWWCWFLPPAWFAAWDDAIAGSGGVLFWILAVIGLTVTGIMVWLAFHKLSRDYEMGMQLLNEAGSVKKGKRAERSWFNVLVEKPPLSWWFKDSVSRTSFVLCAAYLFRDRDVKLRVYPGIAPMLIMPFIFLFQSYNRKVGAAADGFGPAFAGAYLGLVPLMGINLMQYSQQWQASDIFRVAPIVGPAPFCHGARRAVIFFMALPVLVVFGCVSWFAVSDPSMLVLLVPGVLAMPIYALVPHLKGRAIPLSTSTEEARSARRGLPMIFVMFISLGLAALANTAYQNGWLNRMLLVEAILALTAYYILRSFINRVPWRALD